MRVGIVGAGPAAFFFAKRILRRRPEAFLNFFEARCSPFGLLRYGVAPDHPEVKGIARNFSDIVENPNCKIFTNVKIGQQLSLEELRRFHDSVVLATGPGRSRSLAVPGENLRNCFNAAEFVGWYNSDPLIKNISIDLRGIRKVGIIGHGNVALDIARILLKEPDEFKKYQVSQNVLDQLRASDVDEVSFEIAEMREIFKLEHVSFFGDMKPWERELSLSEHIWSKDRKASRLLDLMKKNCHRMSIMNRKSLHIRYMLEPRELLGVDKVDTVRFERTRYVADHPAAETMPQLRSLHVEGTGSYLDEHYDMIITCLGFLPRDPFGLATDSRGVIVNQNGLVSGEKKLYVTGWAATGPRGNITTTLQNATIVADQLLEETMDVSSDISGNERGLDNTLRDRGIKAAHAFDYSFI